MGSLAHKMVKLLKDGKIVVCLQGRYAGKKAVILKTNDDGGKERPYGHCVVAGVAKAPLPITKSMCKPTPKMKKLVQRRSRVKTFVKIVNYTHVMPTRYSVENTMVKTSKVTSLRTPSRTRELRRSSSRLPVVCLKTSTRSVMARGGSSRSSASKCML